MAQTNCPVCKKEIKKRWLYFSSYQARYECPRCKTKLRWNSKRRISEFTAMFVAVLIGFSIFNNQNQVSYRIAMGITAIILFFILEIIFVYILPNQFMIEEKGRIDSDLR